MPESLENLTHRLLHAAQKAGAEHADAIAISETSLSITVRDHSLDQADRSEGRDVGLRVFVGKRQACISASDTRDETLQKLAERAVAMARVAPEDPHIRQAVKGEYTKETSAEFLDLFEDAPEPDASTLQDRALEAEAAAMKVAGVTQIQSASAAFGSTQFHLATSQGFSGGYRRGSHHTSCVAVAGTGTSMERDYDGDARVYKSDLRSPTDIGNSAGERVVANLNPRKPPTGQFPVLFDERVSASLIGHVLGAINGASVARGSTFLRDKLGEMILPPDLSLYEEPHRKRVLGSLPFDAEGLQTQDREIVKDGILTGWTLDLTTAEKLNLKSTASARRGTSSPPSPGTGNVRLTQGPQSKNDLLKDMGTGFLLTSLIGSSVNENTGDYSRGASGFWVENGEVQYPVSECTIAGNLLDMLKTMRPANDARKHISRPIPSLLVEGLTLAGE